MSTSHPRAMEGDVNTAAPRARWIAEKIGPGTRALLGADAAHFLHQSLSTPCLNALSHAEGSWLVDTEGRRYLDFHGNNVHQVGFAHPRVIEAVKRQLDDLSFCTRRYTNAPAVELARRLTAIAPAGLTRTLFAPAGTIAMSMALKLARLVTGRFKTISLWDSFHGATLDAISVGGEAQFREGVGPLLPGAEHVPPCEPSGCPFRCGRECSLSCADYVEYVLGREPGIGAVIGETLRCTPSIPPADYWKRIRAACDRHGALLILDEIPIGLGRTGRMFACEHFGVTPDLLVVGKGLGGGVMPLAAVLAREEFNTVASASLGHFTHEKNPVSAAAGLATLDILRDEHLPEHAARLGAEALEDLRGLAERHPVIHGVRGLGLMLGVDVTGAPHGFADEVMYAALRRGLNFKTTRGHMLTLTPPVNLSREEWKQALAILDASIRECSAGLR